MASFLPTLNAAIGGAIGGFGIVYLASPSGMLDVGSIASGSVVGIVGAMATSYLIVNYAPASVQPPSASSMPMEIAMNAVYGAAAVYLLNMASGGAVDRMVRDM
jgi:hypothetical protein